MDRYIVEEQILGCLLNNKGLTYIDILSEKDFIHTAVIYKAIRQVYSEKKYINPVLVSQEANMDLSTLRTMMNNAFSDTAFESNITALKDETAKLEYKDILNQAIKTESKDIYSAAEKTIEKLKKIAPFSSGNETISLTDAWYQLEDFINNKAKNKGNELHTSIPTLNRITGGFQPGQTITIAARPGVGKSAFALQLSRDIARKDKKVLFISLEMTSEEIMMRIVSNQTNIPTVDLINANLKDNDWGKIGTVLDTASQEKSLIINTSYRTVKQIRRAIITESPDLIVIDYLNLMKSDGESERIRITNLTRELKQLAIEFKIPIIQIAQLNRDSENRFPTLSDLKESGSIEEDSNICMMLYEVKDEKALQDNVPKSLCDELHYKSIISKGNKLIILSVQKNRNGQLKNIPLIFHPQQYKFIEIQRN